MVGVVVKALLLVREVLGSITGCCSDSTVVAVLSSIRGWRCCSDSTFLIARCFCCWLFEAHHVIGG